MYAVKWYHKTRIETYVSAIHLSDVRTGLCFNQENFDVTVIFNNGNAQVHEVSGESPNYIVINSFVHLAPLLMVWAVMWLSVTSCSCQEPLSVDLQQPKMQEPLSVDLQQPKIILRNGMNVLNSVLVSSLNAGFIFLKRMVRIEQWTYICSGPIYVVDLYM